jgi:hypothetical protein
MPDPNGRLLSLGEGIEHFFDPNKIQSLADTFKLQLQ